MQGVLDGSIQGVQMKSDVLLLTTKDVMKWLRLSRTSVWRLVQAGKLASPMKVGDRNRWTEAAVNAYVQAQLDAAPRMRPRRPFKREQAHQIAAYAHAPRRKRRDYSAVIVDQPGERDTVAKLRMGDGVASFVHGHVAVSTSWLGHCLS